MRRLRRASLAGGALLLFVILTGALLEFRPEYAATRLPADLGDPVLVLYFLECGGRSIGEGLDGFWETIVCTNCSGTRIRAP